MEAYNFKYRKLSKMIDKKKQNRSNEEVYILIKKVYKYRTAIGKT